MNEKQASNGLLFFIFAVMFPHSLQKVSFTNHSIELFVPDEEAVKQAWQEKRIAFPYWSKVWPAAIALSNFLVNHSHYLLNKNVLEIGAGLGLPSLVAAEYAKAVVCTDVAAEAMLVADQSIAFHQFNNIKAEVLDWKNQTVDEQADVVLLSDVNYNPGDFETLIAMVEQFLAKGSTLILSTPQRLMAKEFMNAIAVHSQLQEEFIVKDKGENICITITVLQANAGRTI